MIITALNFNFSFVYNIFDAGITYKLLTKIPGLLMKAFHSFPIGPLRF